MHKTIKFLFNSAINSFKAIQLFLVGLALLTMVDFILSNLKIKLHPLIQGVFDIIYKIQSIVYKPDLSIIPVDFTLVVAALEMLITAGLIVYVISFIIEFEEVYDKVHKDGTRRYENKFNKQLEKNAEKIEGKLNSFALLYNMEIDKINDGYGLEDKSFNKAATTNEYLTKLKNLMIQSFHAKSEDTPDGVILFFDKIEQCNKVFNEIYEFTAKSKEILKQSKVRFRIRVAVCLADINTEKSLFLPKLVKLLNIATPNKIMTIANFKTKYETMKECSYQMSGLGDYTFENETITVYTIEH